MSDGERNGSRAARITNVRTTLDPQGRRVVALTVSTVVHVDSTQWAATYGTDERSTPDDIYTHTLGTVEDVLRRHFELLGNGSSL